MTHSTLKPRWLLRRFLALFLALCFTALVSLVPGTDSSRRVPGTGLPDALRQRVDRSGLEEKLSPARAGLEELPKGAYSVWLFWWKPQPVYWAVFPDVYSPDDTESNSGTHQMVRALGEMQRTGEFSLKGIRALDMGVGSGPLSGYLLAEGARETMGADLYEGAVSNAQYNLRQHLPEQADRFRGYVGDLWDALPEAESEPFDLAVFNPPPFSGNPQGPEEAQIFGGTDFSAIKRFVRGLPGRLSSRGKALVRVHRFDSLDAGVVIHRFGPTALQELISSERIPLEVKFVEERGEFVVAVLTHQPVPSAGLEETGPERVIRLLKGVAGRSAEHPFQICFLCNQNLERSPTLQLLLRDFSAKRGMDWLRAESGAVLPWLTGEIMRGDQENFIASKLKRADQRMGIDQELIDEMAKRGPRRVSEKLLRESNLILVTSRFHPYVLEAKLRKALRAGEPELIQARLLLLREALGNTQLRRNLPPAEWGKVDDDKEAQVRQIMDRVVTFYDLLGPSHLAMSSTGSLRMFTHSGDPATFIGEMKEALQPLFRQLMVLASAANPPAGGQGTAPNHAGLEAKTGTNISRRDFLKTGGSAGALLPKPENPDTLLPTVPPDVFGRIAKLIHFYEEWTGQEGGLQKPEELIQDRTAVAKDIESLGQDHPLRRQVAEAEKAFRRELNRFQPADAGAAPDLLLRKEGWIVALDRPEQYPLWAMTRTLPWLLREEFQVKDLDPDRELQRAVRAGMSPKKYLADLAAQYVAPDPRFREMTRFLQERGVPANLSDLQQISQNQLESAHAQLMKRGMQLTTDSLGLYQPTIFLRREQGERIRHVWQEKSHSLFERLKTRFGPDLRRTDSRLWPDPSNDVTLDQVLRDVEQKRVSASLAARRSRLSQRLDDLLQRRPRGSVSEEVIRQEEAKIRGLPDGLLEEIDFDRYLAEVEQRHPAPPPVDLEEQIRRAVAVKRLPAPADPVLELAGKLADSAHDEPAALFIQKGLDNVSLRWRAGAQGEWSRLKEWERDSLRNAGWFSLVQHRRYVVGIDPGISAEEIHRHLRRNGFLWQRAPDEEGVVRWDIQRQQVIALPGPAELAAGLANPVPNTAGTSTGRAGLEERVERTARVTKEAAEGGRAVVLEAGALEANPLLQAMVERLAGLEERILIYGDSPAAREVVQRQPGIAWVRTPAELSNAMGWLAKRKGVERLTYLGGLEEARVVELLAQEWNLSFRAVEPLLVRLLAAFVPEPVARELAAGLEEAELIGGQV